MWRYAGNTAQLQQYDYSAQAIQWATENNIVSSPFEAAKNATRADVAVMLFRYMTLEQNQTTEPIVTEPESTEPESTEPESTEPENTELENTELENTTEPTKNISNTLVVYFSATNNTKIVADYIADTLNADTYQIIPEQQYTSEDLDWTENSSRVNAEHNDPDFRPEIAGELPELSNYDTVFIGYPIWWGEAPNIVKTFVENVDFTGKTIIPFCTSSSSGIGSSGETLEALTSGANWLEGQRFSSRANETDVKDWISSLNSSTDAMVNTNSNIDENATTNENDNEKS